MRSMKLDEDMIESYAYISMRKPASALSVEKLEEALSVESQTEVGKRDYMVRRLLFLSELTLTLLTYGWTRIGKFNRVAHLMPI